MRDYELIAVSLRKHQLLTNAAAMEAILAAQREVLRPSVEILTGAH